MYIKAMFGENARHLPMQIIFQDSGSQNGVALAAFVGMSPNGMSNAAREKGFTHELLVGDMVLRPRRTFGDNNHVGNGLAGLVTSGALFPHDWEYELVDGLYIPNPDYVE
jgi:hypothetical protein